MTKPVVGIAAMMLVEEGRLVLADPVEKYLPEFRGMWMMESEDGDKTRTLRRPSRPITVRDLMTHTSGMMQNPPPGIGELHAAPHKTLAEAVLVISHWLGYLKWSRACRVRSSCRCGYSIRWV
jgi:CubicO group peptidase (beta-lactamase class C family)